MQVPERRGAFSADEIQSVKDALIEFARIGRGEQTHLTVPEWVSLHRFQNARTQGVIICLVGHMQSHLHPQFSQDSPLCLFCLEVLLKRRTVWFLYLQPYRTPCI